MSNEKTIVGIVDDDPEIRIAMVRHLVSIRIWRGNLRFCRDISCLCFDKQGDLSFGRYPAGRYLWFRVGASIGDGRVQIPNYFYDWAQR